MTPSDAPQTDIYTRITNQIITSLEQGVKPWTQPWSIPHKDGPVSRPLRHNGEPYSGINVLTLWASAMGRGFASPTWMTFKQALELGGAVRKGEKGSPVVYASTLKRGERDEKTGEDVERDIPYMKAYTVFNIEQIDGLPERFQAPLEILAINPDQRIAEAEAFFTATGAQIDHQGHRAYYAPGPDQIVLPRFEVFRDAESYYATLGHECIHNAERRIMPRGGARALIKLVPIPWRLGIIFSCRRDRGLDVDRLNPRQALARAAGFGNSSPEAATRQIRSLTP